MPVLIEGLAHGPRPAFAGIEHTRGLAKDNHAGHTAYARSELSLTQFGESILSYKEDFSRHNPIDRWWGGTHLANDNLWRSDLTLTRP